MMNDATTQQVRCGTCDATRQVASWHQPAYTVRGYGADVRISVEMCACGVFTTNRETVLVRECETNQ